MSTLRGALLFAVWAMAILWLVRVWAGWRGLPHVPNLLEPRHDLSPAGAPWVTVIVPARNEAANIVACLESLLAQEYAQLRIVAVNDRSTDATGPLMEALAQQHPERLQVLHIAELPPRWLGKTHANAVAAAQAIEAHQPDFLLFTDADVSFRPDALRRGLAYVVAHAVDHLVLGPTTIIKRWDEAALLSFFQIFGLWAARPWKVSDPDAKDAIGIGAFNLLRTSAYLQIGGYESLRMAVVEDLGLARRVKSLRLSQHFVFGPGMVGVHWAAGVGGLVNVMTKNTFAAFNFHPVLLLFACAWIAAFCISPFALIFYAPARLPAGLIVLSIGACYVLMERASRLNPWNFLLAPLAAATFIFTLLKSMVLTLRQGGIIWRGTFYSLAELRANMAPLRAPRHRPST